MGVLQWIATLLWALWNLSPVDVSDLMAIGGVGLVLCGLAWWSVPLACVAAGVILVILSLPRK